MKKKAIILLSVILTTSMMLAACGGTKTGSTTATVTPAASTAAGATSEAPKTEISSLKPYKVTLFYPGSTQPDEKLVEEKMNAILTAKINATIDIQAVDWGAWTDKMNLLFASGEPSDLVFTTSWNNHNENVKKGAFLPLDDLLKKYGQDILKNENPDFLKGARIDGKLYAVPTNKEIASTRGVLYRKDIAEKYKMDFSKVKTLEDLEPFLKTIKDNETGMTPLFESGTQTIPAYVSDWDTLGDSAIPGAIHSGGTDTKLVNIQESEVYLKNLKLMHSWFTKGYINKDAATSKLQANETVKTGKVFMWPESLKPGKDKEMEAVEGFPLSQVEITPGYITTGDTTNSMIGISKTSKDPERSMMVLNLLHSDKELLNLLDWGVEGVHYVKVSDNVATLPKGVDPAKRTYNHGSNWMFGDQFLSYLWDNEDPQKWDNFRKFNAAAKPSVGLGFAFDSAPVKSEMAVMANVTSEFSASLETGAVDPDVVLKKYVDKQKASGLDRIIAEKQKQFDAFLAKQK